jgi:hypothetical protein
MLQRTLPTGFIAPCLPTKTDKLPSGSQWLHEIKHDGFPVIARKTGAQVRLYSRPGNDLTRRFPLIVETLARLRSRSCIIDGEAVACDDNGVASFDLVRHHRANESIFLYAFDLIELNGDDLRRDWLEVRNATLASIVAKARPGATMSQQSFLTQSAHSVRQVLTAYTERPNFRTSFSGIGVVRSDGIHGEVSDPRVSGIRPIFVAALAAAMLPPCTQSCDPLSSGQQFPIAAELLAHPMSIYRRDRLFTKLHYPSSHAGSPIAIRQQTS